MVRAMLRGALAIVVASALIAPARSSAATRPDGCPVDADFWAARFAPATRIELLIAAGNTIPTERRSSYDEMGLAIVNCAPDGAHLDIYPITDFGIGRSPSFSGSAPRATSNPLVNQRDRADFLTGAQSSIDEIVNSHKTYSGSDPIGTLYTAGDVIRRAPSGKTLLVVIANGWQQANSVNLFRYRDDPSKHADEVIRRLRGDHALPDLGGAEVIFAGVTRGDSRMKAGYREILGLRRFWERLIHASSGALVTFDELLPGFVSGG